MATTTGLDGEIYNLPQVGKTSLRIVSHSKLNEIEAYGYIGERKAYKVMHDFRSGIYRIYYKGCKATGQKNRQFMQVGSATDEKGWREIIQRHFDRTNKQ